MRRWFTIALLCLCPAWAWGVFPNGWNWKCELVIESDYVTATLSNYPVLFTESNLPPDLFVYARSDGGDIRFSSDSAGATEFAAEVKSYNAGGTAQIYGGIPSVSPAVDTTVWIWYGNAEATMPAADSTYGSQAVWSDYAGVYHCEDASGNLTDSSANALHMTPTGSPTYGAIGKIGKGVQTGVGKYFIATAPNPSFPYSVSVWGSSSDVTTLQGAAVRMKAGAVRFGGVFWAGSGDLIQAYEAYEAASATTNYYMNTFHLGTGVFNATNSREAYIDGGSKGSNAGTPYSATFDRIGVGTPRTDGVWPFNGILDEVRFASFDYSDAWVAADYANQNAPDTFVIEGTPEATASVSFGLPIIERLFVR